MEKWHAENSRMNKPFQLYWGSGQSNNSMLNPDWDDVEKALYVARVGGAVELSEQGRIHNGLQMYSTERRYVLMLGQDQVDDYVVRSLFFPEVRPEMVEILGDLWDSRTVTSDMELVTRIFKEFFETRDVSQELMS